MTTTGPDERFLVGLDLGTQSVRALLADLNGRTLACASRPTPTLHPAPGQGEYEPEGLWQCVLAVLREVAASVPEGGRVAGIACASIGESCVLIDAAGAPLANAITWFDRRTEPVGAALFQRVGAERLFRITGAPPDPTFTVCKLLWYRQVMPDTFARARRVLNIAQWIAFRLSGEMAADLALASRTMLLDVHARQWSAEMLELAGLDVALLPPLRPSGTVLGPVRAEVLAETGLPGRPVVGVGGHDHVCGGFAAGAARAGVLLDSLGTAEALFQTVGGALLTEQAASQGFFQGAIGLAQPLYYVGAGINSCGGSIEWARGLVGGGIERERLIAEAAAVAPGSDGTCFLPHLAYSPPPHRDLAARGAFVGLTTGTGRAALFRSVLEGVALEARLVVDAIAALPGVGTPDEIRLIGGSTKNRLLLRIKASVYGRPLTVIDQPEATALGAALLGGIAAGIWPDVQTALADLDQSRHVVEPDVAWTHFYAELFESAYRGLYAALAPTSHTLARMTVSHVA